MFACMHTRMNQWSTTTHIQYTFHGNYTLPMQQKQIMHAFETDASNATLNPLYRPKEKTKAQPPAKLPYRWWVVQFVRIVLFLILPIVLIWMMPYRVLYSYMWICYVLVGQTTVLRSVIDANNKLWKPFGALVVCCVLISIGIEFVPDTAMHT